MIFVLTGNGKGKTTGAIGMGVRAAGAGKKVLMVQFLKAGGYSEEKTIANFANFQVQSFGRSCFVKVKGTECLTVQGTRFLEEEDFKLAQEGWEMAKKSIEQKQCDFLILDEITLAMQYGLLKQEEVLDFLGQHGKDVDVVLTGRDCPQEILAIADLVTEMKEIKHPFQQGVKQRKGIEF